MTTSLSELWNAIWCTWVELAPWLLIGAVMAGLMHVIVPAHLIQRQLSGPWGPLRAVLFGIPLPLCSCGVIPAALQLKKDGAKDGSVLGFLIATPQTGVDSVFASASLLGWPFAWFKVVSALFMGLLGGYGLKWSRGDEPEITEVQEPLSCGHAHHDHHHHHSSAKKDATFKERLHEAWGFICELIDNLAGWLVIGVLISAALDVMVPKEVFASIAQWGSVTVTLAVLGLSLPLYVCATASVPIAASLVAQGLPLGAALVFLMAGPATNVATMGALYRSVGVRALCWYLGTIIFGSVVLAYVLDQHLGWVPNLAVGHLHRHEASTWELVVALVLAVWVSKYLLARARYYLFGGQPASLADQTHQIVVEGMTCQSCVRSLHQKIRGLGDVSELDIDLDSGQVKVRGKFQLEDLQGAVRDAGFEIHEHGPSCGHHDHASHEHGPSCGHEAQKEKPHLPSCGHGHHH